MTLDYLRHKLPQLNERDLDGLPADFARYQRQVSQALHEMSRVDLRAMRDLQIAPTLLVAYATNAPLAVAQDSSVALAFDTVVIDTASWWNATTHRFVPQEAGFYRCAWAVDLNDTAGIATAAYLSTTCANCLAIRYGNGAASELGVSGETLIESDGASVSIGVDLLVHGATSPTIVAYSPHRTWLAINYLGKRPLY